MFKDAGSGIRIFCDYKSKVLRVQTNAFAAYPQFRARWDEVAQYDKGDIWNASEHAKQVSSESALDDIAWFWHDLKSEPPTESQATSA